MRFSAQYESEERTKLIAAAVGNPAPPVLQVARKLRWNISTTHSRIKLLIEAGAISTDRTVVIANAPLPLRKKASLAVCDFEHFTCQCGASCVVGQVSALHQPMLCSTCRADRVEAIIAARRLAA